MTLTIYSSNFDSDQTVLNNGMSGKIFLDPSQNDDPHSGKEFSTLDSALTYADTNNIVIDKVEIMYNNGGPKFKRFVQMSERSANNSSSSLK